MSGPIRQVFLSRQTGMNTTSPERWQITGPLLTGVIDAGAYGARGDGVSDDTAAIQAALTAAQTGSYTVSIPAGIYILSALLTYSAGTPLRIIGAGRDKTELRWIASSGGLSCTFGAGSNNYQNLELSDLTLSTAIAGGGTAISASWPSNTSSVNAHALIENVNILSSPVGSAAHYWTNGIVLTNANTSTLAKLLIEGGAVIGYPALSGTGIDFAGGTSATGMLLSQVDLFFWNNAVLMETAGQGLLFSNGQIVNCVNGVVLQATSISNSVDASIVNSYIDAYGVGVNIGAGWAQWQVADNLIYAEQTTNASTPANVTAIQVGAGSGQATQEGTITGNSIVGITKAGSTQNLNGIVFAATASGNIAAANVLTGHTFGMIAQTSSSNNLLMGNNLYSNGTNFSDSGTGNIGPALVALGGGAAPTLGTIGGSGPTVAAQNAWMKLKDSTGAAFFVPVWK